MPQPGALDQPFGSRGGAGDCRYVHTWDELDACADRSGSNRPDRSHTTGAERGLSAPGFSRRGRASDDNGAAVHSNCAIERDVRWQYSTPDGRGLGPFATAMVHKAARKTQDAGQFDSVRRGRYIGDGAGRTDRGWQAGSVSVIVERVRGLLCVDLSGDVCYTADRPERHELTSAHLVEVDCFVGLPDDVVVRRRLDHPYHSCGKPVFVCGQNRRLDCDSKSSWFGNTTYIGEKPRGTTAWGRAVT